MTSNEKAFRRTHFGVLQTGRVTTLIGKEPNSSVLSVTVITALVLYPVNATTGPYGAE